MNLDAKSTYLSIEKLKPILHNKIERMSDNQLNLLNRVLVQIEVEELAERIGSAFEQDQAEGKLKRIPELVCQFRSENRY